MLEALASKPVAWDALEVFQVDERAVAFDDERRNARRIRDLLCREGGLAPSRLHCMPVTDEPLEAAAARHARTLVQHAGAPPKLDIAQLGLGPDGHTASLVPGDPLLAVNDAEVGISAPYQGTRRMSLTYPALNRARRILWLVTGAGKAEMLARLVTGDPSIPAGRVARAGAVVFADAEAAARLPQRAGARA
jgi:6-phosphogluconolactonase/glucosamine-6-phosphate isomerase/deaminase